MPRPARVVKHRAGQRHCIGLTAGDDGFGLLGLGDQPDCDGENADLGFDALRGDDEGFDLTPAGLGSVVRAMAQRCRAERGGVGPALVVALEGGYKLPAIREAAASVMRALLERRGGTSTAAPS
jgi:hypothetical protein